MKRKPEESAVNLKPVYIKPRVRGVARMGPARVTLTSSGRSPVSVFAAKLLMEAAEGLGLDPENFTVSYQVDAETGKIAVYPEAPGAPNTIMVRRDQKQRPSVFYLADVLEQYGALRPERRLHCAVSPGPDPDGNACIIISVFGSLVKGSGPNNAKDVMVPAVGQVAAAKL